MRYDEAGRIAGRAVLTGDTHGIGDQMKEEGNCGHPEGPELVVLPPGCSRSHQRR